jgi:hypothetical protein
MLGETNLKIPFLYLPFVLLPLLLVKLKLISVAPLFTTWPGSDPIMQ